MFLGENYINLCHPDELNLEASFRKKKNLISEIEQMF